MFDWLTDLFSNKKNVKELSLWLDTSEVDLSSIDLSYRQFAIKKKSGKKRFISSPNNNLKNIQRKILFRILKNLKTHPLATGFQPGISFVENARCHQSQKIVIKIDIVDFFPSISEKRILEYFHFIGWNKQAAKLLTALTTTRGTLPQGAPTSPRLSNLVNFRMDHRLAGLAKKHNAVFTRYADDITFSFSEENAEVNKVIRAIFYILETEGYRPHKKKKLSVRRNHRRQVVTGLVVNERAKLPREKRRWLRAVKHRSELVQKGGYLGPRPTLNDEQIQGWDALQQHIDS